MTILNSSTLFDDFATLDDAQWESLTAGAGVGVIGPVIVAGALRLGGRNESWAARRSLASYDLDATTAVSWHWRRNPTGLGSTAPSAFVTIGPGGATPNGVRVWVTDTPLVNFACYASDGSTIAPSGNPVVVDATFTAAGADKAECWHRLTFDPAAGAGAGAWQYWVAPTTGDGSIPAAWTLAGTITRAGGTPSTGHKVEIRGVGSFDADGMFDFASFNAPFSAAAAASLSLSPTTAARTITEGATSLPSDVTSTVTYTGVGTVTASQTSGPTNAVSASVAGGVVTVTAGAGLAAVADGVHTVVVTATDGTLTATLTLTLTVDPAAVGGPSSEVLSLRALTAGASVVSGVAFSAESSDPAVATTAVTGDNSLTIEATAGATPGETATITYQGGGKNGQIVVTIE